MVRIGEWNSLFIIRLTATSISSISAVNFLNEFDGVFQLQRFCGHNRADRVSSSLSEMAGSIFTIMTVGCFGKRISQSCKVGGCNMGSAEKFR